MPNDTPNLSDALSKLSPDELQQLHTATYQIKFGKVPGNFDSAKVDQLWNGLNRQVAAGPGNRPDEEHYLREGLGAQAAPSPLTASGWKQMFGVMGAGPLPGMIASAAQEAGAKWDVSKPQAALGAAGGLLGLSQSKAEQEAALGHTKTIAVMAGLPLAMTLIGAKSALTGEPVEPTASTFLAQEAQKAAAHLQHPAEGALPVEVPNVTPKVAPKPVEPTVGNAMAAKPVIGPSEVTPPPAPTAKSIIDQVNAGTKLTRLPEEQLRLLGSMTQQEAAEHGLGRSDWMSVQAKVRRLDAPEQPAATPTQAVHRGITAVVKERLPIGRVTDVDTAIRREDELRDFVTQVAKSDPQTRTKAVDSLDARADAANRQAAEIRRVQDAADYNAEITKIRRENLATSLGQAVPGEQVGFDPNTGRPVVAPEIDPKTGKPVTGKTPRFITGITQERRQLLGFLAGEEQGRWRLARDPITGEAQPLPKLSEAQKAERDTFVQKMGDQLNQWRADVLAQGGRPTEEQLGEGEKLVAGLQAASGKRFLYSGKKGLNVDEFGVATWQGIDPNQAWWNKAMGRPVTSHFAKPDPIRIRARLDQLDLEARTSTQIADRLRNSLAQDLDAAKTKVNGSGESAASAEAVGRVQAERAQGIRRVRTDTRSGISTPIANTVDAVDLRPGRYDRIEIVKPDGGRETVAEGPAARPNVRPAGTPIDQASKIADSAAVPVAEPAPQVSTAPKPGVLNSDDVAALKHIISLDGIEPADKARAMALLNAHEAATRTEPKPVSSERQELAEELPRLQKQLKAAKSKGEQERLRTTIAAYQEKLGRPEVTPEQSEQITQLQLERQKLARLQETGRGAGKTWNPATQKYDRPGAQAVTAKTISKLESDLGEAAPAAPPTAAAVIAGTKAIKAAPPAPKPELGTVTASDAKVTEPDAGSEDLMTLLQASHEEIPGALLKNLEALHDPKSPLPKEGLDYIARTIIDSEKLREAPMGDVATQYLRSLTVYKDGLAKKNPMALSNALKVAKYGSLNVPPGQAGFVNAGFLLDMVNEVGRYSKNAAIKTSDVLGYVRDFMEHGMWMGVPPPVKDLLFKYKGEVTRAQDLARIALNDGIKRVRSLPLSDQLELVREYQSGERHADPELQGLSDIVRQLQGKMWVEMRQSGRPNLAWWEDHLRNFYERPSQVTPGAVTKYASAVDAALLKGDQGMFRERHYKDLLDGMAAGHIPATTNLFEMHLMDLGRQAQYVAAQHLLESLKGTGRLVKGASAARTGLLEPIAVPDYIQSRWFPTKDANGNPIIAAGETWFGEKGDVNALKNWLQPDYVRKNVVGKAIIGFKNLYTPIELMGPYHAFSVMAKAVSLDLTQGVNRAYTGGVHGDLGELMHGFGDALTALKAPYSFYKEGRALQEASGQTYVAWQKYNYNKQDFLASDMGQRLEKLYPGMQLDKVIDAALEGGMRFDVNPDYQLQWRKSVVNSWKQHNYIKSVAQVPFAAVEAVTSPLFQKYIPALKLGAVAREIDVEEARNADAIANGEISLATVHQRAVRRIDNVLGEVNWDNFYLRKWQKSLFQVAYRSPGWRLGTLDLTKNALWGQMREGYQALANRRIPTMDPNMLYLASETALMAGASAIFMNLFAHKAPSSLTDVTAPQTGDVDSRGKPIRVNWPLYTSRDVPEILANPARYAIGGQTGFIQRGKEALENRSFTGVEIGGVGARIAHAVIPNTFAVSGIQRMEAQGVPRSTAILNLFGMNPARRDLDMTDAEKLLSERARRTTVTRTVDEEAKTQARQRIEAAYLSGHYQEMGQLINEAVTSQQLKPNQIQQTIREARTPYIQRVAKGLKATDLVDAYKVASPVEKAELMRLLVPKLRGNPKAVAKFQEALSGK